MFTGPFSPQSRLADFYETIEVTDADSPHDPIDFSSVTDAQLRLRYPADDEYDAATFSLDDGYVAFPSDGVILLQIPQASLSAMDPGNYRLLLTLTVDSPVDQTVTVLDATLPLI